MIRGLLCACYLNQANPVTKINRDWLSKTESEDECDTECRVSSELKRLTSDEVSDVHVEPQHAEVVLDDVGNVKILVASKAEIVLSKKYRIVI